MLAEQALAKALTAFQIDWQKHGGVTELSSEQTMQMINDCKLFLMQVHEIVCQETKMWAVAFQDVHDQFELANKVTKIRDQGEAGPESGVDK